MSGILSEKFRCGADFSLNLSVNLSVFARMEHYLRQNKLEFSQKFSANNAQLIIKVSQNEQKALLDFAQKLGISP